MDDKILEKEVEVTETKKVKVKELIAKNDDDNKLIKQQTDVIVAAQKRIEDRLALIQQAIED